MMKIDVKRGSVEHFTVLENDGKYVFCILEFEFYRKESLKLTHFWKGMVIAQGVFEGSNIETS